MGGFFGVVSQRDCVSDLFYGTDYHSHLGTQRGGLAVRSRQGFTRFIHDITNAQFRSKFENDIRRMRGRMGIGVISDNDDQPLLISSHLGSYAIVTVGVVRNLEALRRQAFRRRVTHFSECSAKGVSPTEMVATLINGEATFEEGIARAQEAIEGSCSLLLLTAKGLYVARDRLGRTPVVLGRKKEAWAAAVESCAFPNLDYHVERYLGPGEIVRLTLDGVETLRPPKPHMQICAFLWVYYGYPASCYEGVNVEQVRYRCGAALARRDEAKADLVAGIPDSGTGHGLGYAAAAGIPYQRPFVKYTPTWPRSFMPSDQRVRDLVARMKLIPVREIIEGRRIMFCEDSIVRGTQLRDTVARLMDAGAREVHVRVACPPLLFACKFLHFSPSRSELELAGRKAIQLLEGRHDRRLEEYVNPDSSCAAAMVEVIRKKLGLTTLRYQRLEDLLAAIGLAPEKVCTYCWNGREHGG